MTPTFLAQLKNPDKTFRGAPFWAWNAKLQPAELRRQIRIMKKMGLGGFFMHSRVGLNTEYLGKDWFRCVEACIDEAKKLNMSAWLYDEDRFPSGAAGGKVTKIFPQYRARWIAPRFCGDEEATSESSARSDLAWYAIKGHQNGKIEAYRRVNGPDVRCSKNETLLIVAVQVEATSPWYNDGTYLDTLNPEAVAKFIEVTHEAYRQHFSAEFSHVIPGIFTDEPNFGNPTPWTDILPSAFREHHGYDVLDHLPELFFKVGGVAFSKVRLDFKETVTQLFVNAFGKLIGDWCEQNGLEYTGHVLEEDTINKQANVVGEAMRFYEHMQAPGVDLLTEHWQIFRTIKQCTSMAHQFDRRRRLSETYGCTGWDFAFEGHKALGDWQFALGINFRCQHLAWYSMAATAKRDYPASTFRQSPWYGVHGEVEDYFARIAETLFAENAKEVRDLLVIHPIESAWGVKIDQEDAAVKLIDIAFTELGSRLLGSNIDFDYGSEAIMAQHGCVKGRKLFVAKAGYKAVVLPAMLTIRSSTLKLLTDFVADGGTVCAIGEPPAYVDGLKTDAAQKAFKLFTSCSSAEQAADVLAPVVRRLSLVQDGVETEATLHLISVSKSALNVFVCNTSAQMPTFENEMDFPFVRDRTLTYPDAELQIFSKKRGDVYEINPRTGTVHRVKAHHARGVYHIPCPLGRLESRLFVITDENPGRTLAPYRRAAPFTERIELRTQAIKIACSEPNVMVLDHACCAVDGGPTGEKTFILTVDTQLRAALNAPARGGQMVQPWVAGNPKPERDLSISLTYTFTCEHVPADPVRLGIERPDLYTISLNGKTLAQQDKGYWMDPAIRQIALPQLRKGKNVLVLKGRYHQYLPGLEAVYLLGRFGVREDSTLTQAPSTLDIGDWVTQGLENYGGNVTYTFAIGKRPATKKRVFLRIPEWRGVTLGVSVNGGEETLLPWPPYEQDVTAELRDMRNTVKVTVYGHRRNVCGPFYLKDNKFPVWAGAEQMEAYETQTRGLVPCGLLAPVELAY